MIPFLVVLWAWFFQSITGFGAGIFIIGILSLLYDPKMVIVSSAIFNLFGTLSLIYQNRKGKVELCLLSSLVLGSIPGIYLGAYTFHKINSKDLLMLIALFIIFLGFYDLLVHKSLIPFRIGRHMGVPMGFLGGYFAGLVGMGGPPPLIFLIQQIKDPSSIKLMLNLYFTSNILLRLTFYKRMEVVSLDWTFLSLGLLGLLVGIVLGGLLSKRILADQYRAGVSYTVIILGFVLLVLGEL
ncbi:MAG: sulfite exporter TauE/SafE family protein [Aquificaceae bacterium]